MCIETANAEFLLLHDQSVVADAPNRSRRLNIFEGSTLLLLVE